MIVKGGREYNTYKIKWRKEKYGELHRRKCQGKIKRYNLPVPLSIDFSLTFHRAVARHIFTFNLI